MKYCTNCGEPLKPGNRFCSNCGTQINLNKFDIDEHLGNLQKNGMQIVNKSQKIETKKWDVDRYLNDVFNSIVAGGFTYFTYGEILDEAEFVKGVILRTKETRELRKKNPLLLDDEKVEYLGDFKRSGTFGGHGGTTYGPMYYTGRRFILDTVEFETETHMGHEAEYSLPLTSYWIKPSFNSLLKKLGINYYYQEGTFRKKRYQDIEFKIHGIEKPGLFAENTICCGYYIIGDEKKFYDSYKQHLLNLDEKPIEEFENKLEKMIEDAKETDVSSLIEHTYECKQIDDSVIETSLAYGGKKLSEAAYSLCGLFGKIV